MRTEKALYNLMGNVLLQVVAAAVGFILPVLFIQHYGSTVNGMIGSIKQFIVYLSLVEAGVGAASMVALYKPLLNQNNISINAILSATSLFYRKSGYLFLGGLLLIAVLYPLLVKNEVEPIISSLMVLILGAGGLAEYFLIGKYRVLINADQRNYIISLIQAFTTILNAVVIVILILHDTHVLVVQAAATMVFVVQFLTIRWYVKKNYSYITFSEEPDFESIDQRWSALVHQIAALIVYNSPAVIITVFLGLKAVSIYVVYNMIFTAVNQMVAVFNAAVLAGFGQLIAGQDVDALRKTYANYEYIFYGIIAWVFTCTALLIMPFMSIYTAGFIDANYIRPDIAVLLLVTSILGIIKSTMGTLIRAAGHFRETQTRSLLEAAINLCASLVLVQPLGLVGVLLGAVCSNSYRVVDTVLYTSKHILQQSPLPIIKRILSNAALAFIAAIAFLFWIDIQAINYGQWFLWATGVAIFVFIVIASGNILVDKQMYRMTLQLVKRVSSSIVKSKAVTPEN